MTCRNLFAHGVAALAMCAALGSPISALGQVSQTGQTEIAGNDNWSVVVSPYIWAASLSGNGAIGRYDVPVRVPFSTILGNLDLALMGEVELTNGRYGVYMDGQYTSDAKDATVAGAAVRFGTTAKMVTLGGFFHAWSIEKPGNTLFGKSRAVTIEPTFGLRWTQVNASADPIVGTHTERWVDPFIGVRVSADLSERWNLFAEGDIGGFGIGSRFSANLQTYFGYRTFVFNKPTILRFGYRVWYQDYVNDGGGIDRFAWRVTQHGPVAGLSMVF
ncbi:hypothetical protein [Pandoraea bronchicola]|uniref:Outer membrane protein beta-barrel domain-containing protein n=1 Tax=Pandoraea bronchicola TaxID=2508287 RepID=A0A5E5BYF6_9BURK|nr:hypothetical protein [Pandoraea bronchicola]VVE90508.1 hypothetical protein PBR20603_04493 [Pandoraea bronchicola]